MLKFIPVVGSILLWIAVYGCASSDTTNEQTGDLEETNQLEEGSAAEDDGVLNQPGFEPTAPDLPSFNDWELPLDCDPGTMPILGQPGCHNIGRMCPEGDWPDELPSEVPLLFVHPEGGGDGLSMDNPMGSIQMALDSSLSGGWVIVAKGEYNEPIVSRRGINIRGACAMETLINPEFSRKRKHFLIR